MIEDKLIGEEKYSRVLIVPWYNKDEWLQTYNQVYSENVELQEKAYTTMCVWKVRCPNLPMGVECTMSMLHVMLCNRQKESKGFKERDLRLLYSTAVMRFLNHLSVMSSCKASMYKMAEEQNIPDWLINLRHEAAHGNSLPALYLLHQAADIIMQWLKVQYWEVEAAVMEDVVINSELDRAHEVEEITKLLELFLVLKINYWSGHKTIDNITDKDVRKKAMELAAEEGLGIKCTSKTSKKKDLMKDTLLDNDITIASTTQEYTHKIKTAFEPLLRKLFNPLNEKKQKRAYYQESLIQSLVHYSGFCPEIVLDNLGELEVQELMSLLGELWKEAVEGLQARSLLAPLMTSLMSPQVKAGQLWLRLITHFLAGQPPPQPVGTTAVCQLLADNLPCHIDPQVLIRKANSHHKKHQRPMELKKASGLEMITLQNLAHNVLENPTIFTSKYLYSLLSFWETPLSEDTKEKLCQLAKIYTGHKVPRSPTNGKVYTLASFQELGLDMPQPELPASEDDTSPWKLCNGDFNWEQCALGTLPWSPKPVS